MNPIMQQMNARNNASNNNMFNQFMSFRNNFNGNDNQAAEKIASMLNSGQISKQDLTNAVNMAKQFKGILG